MRGVGGGTASNLDALELFYRTLIMGSENGEAQHLAACGALVRVRGPSALLRVLRARPQRLRTAQGPVRPPPPITIDPQRWLRPHPLADAPYRRRVHQWRVIFSSKIVARTRPSTKAPIAQAYDPGQLLWSGALRADGWLPLCERSHLDYVLIDATPLGLGPLLEEVVPPRLESGACAACYATPCCCKMLEAYGQ